MVIPYHMHASREKGPKVAHGASGRKRDNNSCTIEEKSK